jgi:rhodanese-related sulfurtransferase
MRICAVEEFLSRHNDGKSLGKRKEGQFPMGHRSVFSMLAGLAILVSPISYAADNGAAQQGQVTPAGQSSDSTPVHANDPAYTYKTLRLTRGAFDALAARPEQLLVLDIRRPDEVTKYGGFPVYLSVQTNDVQKYLAFIPQNKLIVTVSNHAHRAGAVGDILTSYGYHVVGAIGVLDYEAEGGALTKIAPVAARAASATAPSPQGSSASAK